MTGAQAAVSRCHPDGGYGRRRSSGHQGSGSGGERRDNGGLEWQEGDGGGRAGGGARGERGEGAWRGGLLGKGWLLDGEVELALGFGTLEALRKDWEDQNVTKTTDNAAE